MKLFQMAMKLPIFPGLKVINPVGNTNEPAVDVYFGTYEGMKLKKGR